MAWLIIYITKREGYDPLYQQSNISHSLFVIERIFHVLRQTTGAIYQMRACLEYEMPTQILNQALR